mgnify:CR=1 FL=1
MREIKRVKDKKGKIKKAFFVPWIVFSILSKKNGFTAKEETKIKREKRIIGNKEENKIWKLLALFPILTILIMGRPIACSAIKAKLKSVTTKAHNPKASAPKVFKEK